MELSERIVQLESTGKTFVLATIVEIVGSTPRKPGSRMIVHESGDTEGTIGGGALEQKVIEDAVSLFKGEETLLRTYDLTKEMAMCCGGRVTLFFERVHPHERLLIFGAGHVAQPLATMAKYANFHVTVVDERESYLNAERFAHVDRRLTSPLEDIQDELSFGKDLYIVICTHDHKLDQKIAEVCLKQPFRYLGLIGSQVKAAKTRARLKAAGFDADAIQRLRCPLGLDLGSQTPGEIAVAILAEIIALRHGALPPYDFKRPQESSLFTGRL